MNIRQKLRKRKCMYKTMFFRGFVLVSSYFLPQIFGISEYSLFTLGLSISYTVLYYINEKGWEKI